VDRAQSDAQEDAMEPQMDYPPMDYSLDDPPEDEPRAADPRDDFGLGYGAQNGFAGNAPLPIKSVPANIEAERAVLGALMIDPDAIIKVANFLRAEDFYRERHGWIYEAMSVLNERHEPLDFVTLTDELERRSKLEEVGGPAYLTDLISNTPTAIYVDHYARIVERTAVLRRLISAAGKIAELAYDESQDVDEVVDRAEQIVFGVSESRIHRDLTPIRAIITNVVERIDFLTRNRNTLMGVPTGFVKLDEILGGMQKSDLIILAGRPGMGKTSFGLSMALNAARRNSARVAVFSLEMSNEQLVQRLLSMETAIDSHRLRLGNIHEDEWPILLEGANMLAATPIFIDDTPAASVNDLRTKARRLYAEHGLDMILIDYMQLMTGSGGGSGRNENRQQEISYISRSLKSLARELNVPVIALSQLSRAVEARSDKRPMLSDLRESGSIEQDADVVLFIYREDYYVEDSDRQNIADVMVAKHRHGSTGNVSLFFRKELTQFRDLEIQRTDLDY
jgi:replicative DNA helicase